MNVKSELLRIFSENPSDYVSGEELAKRLSVSRNAVWKAVQSMRGEGYHISAVTNKGYRLDSNADVVSAQAISACFRNPGIFHVEFRKSVDSTNTALREMADRANLAEGFVLAADGQSAGKGRRGRGFFSPPGHGIYFSILLKIGNKTVDAALITALAAVAASMAIEEIMGITTGIKWVNDLYLNNKKVCGILTEAVYDMESGRIETAVLGIGINVTTPPGGYPHELKDIVTALTDKHTAANNERCRLIAATLDNFMEHYRNLSELNFLNEYRKRSIIIGREVDVVSLDGSTKKAQVLKIDDRCGLVVKYKDGKTATLTSGEVRIVGF